MYINEVEIGSTLKVIVDLNKNNTLVLETTIKELGNKSVKNMFYIVVDPLYYNEKLLNFGEIKCRIEIVNLKDNRVYAFNDVIIKSVNRNDKKEHYMFSGISVKPLNRREAVRVPFNETVVVKIGSDKKRYVGVTHDLSATGISIRLKCSLDVNVGDSFSASFEYKKLGLSYKVNGVVVRCVAEGENSTLLGCAMTQYPTSLNAVIAELLRQECKLKR